MSGTAAWPPSNGVTSKIVPRENAVFQISYSTVVRAPAPLVFDTVLHAADYPAWNTWVPRAEILTQPSSSEGPQDGKASDDAVRLPRETDADFVHMSPGPRSYDHRLHNALHRRYERRQTGRCHFDTTQSRRHQHPLVADIVPYARTTRGSSIHG